MMKPGQVTLWALIVATTLIVVALVAGQRNNARPSFTSLLASTGVYEQKEPMNEEQSELIRRISSIYADEDDLGARERELLAGFKVDSSAQPKLKVLFNQRLSNSLRMERLLERLTEVTKSLMNAAEPAAAAAPADGV